RGLDLDEIARCKEFSQRRGDPHAPDEERPPVGMLGPERHRRSFGSGGWLAPKSAGERSQDRYGAGRHRGRFAPPHHPGKSTVKATASSPRKGNLVEADGKLSVAPNAENFPPGKGTPTPQVDMRRISDGVKVAQRFKTTDQVERAHVE